MCQEGCEDDKAKKGGKGRERLFVCFFLWGGAASVSFFEELLSMVQLESSKPLVPQATPGAHKGATHLKASERLKAR